MKKNLFIRINFPQVPALSEHYVLVMRLQDKSNNMKLNGRVLQEIVSTRRHTQLLTRNSYLII